MGTAAKVSTPCIRLCKLDINGICTGCNRSWRQIADWSSYSEQKRLEIMESLSSNLKNERQRK